MIKFLRWLTSGVLGVLLVAVAVLWVRSHLWPEQLVVSRNGTVLDVRSASGRVNVRHVSGGWMEEPLQWWHAPLRPGIWLSMSIPPRPATNTYRMATTRTATVDPRALTLEAPLPTSGLYGISSGGLGLSPFAATQPSPPLNAVTFSSSSSFMLRPTSTQPTSRPAPLVLSPPLRPGKPMQPPRPLPPGTLLASVRLAGRPVYTPYAVRYRTIALVPLALLLVVNAAPLTRMFVRRRRSQRGHCVTCGYDLRGSPSGTCPECGTSATLQKERPGVVATAGPSVV